MPPEPAGRRAPELCACWDEALERVLERGEIVHDTFDFPGTGGLRHFEVTLEPELADNGAVVGVISAACDMTRHIAAERALAKRDEQLCHALSAANAGAWEWDLSTLELSLWPECDVLYGIAPTASASHAQWRRNVHPEDVPAVSSAFAAVVAGEQEKYRCEFRIQHPQRGTRWLVERFSRSSLLLGLLSVGHVQRDARHAFRDQDGNAVLEVADDGIGIDASQQPRVFDMFAQVAPSAGSGFGIGLALVQRIVQMHGGRVAVRSDGLEKGTVFTITLPSCHETERNRAHANP